MSYDYAAKVESARKQIAKFGFLSAIRKLTQSYGPEFEPVRMDPTFHGIRLVEIGASSGPTESRVEGERRFLAEATAVVPEVNDLILLEAAEVFLTAPVEALFHPAMRISRVEPLRPGGVVVVYQLTAVP